MKVQELIHQLSAEYIDPNAEVAIWMYDTRMGETDLATVEKVTAIAGRVELELLIYDEAGRDAAVAAWQLPRT